MKNKAKGLLLFAIILLVSGCNANYNIDIKKNLRIEENITMIEKNSVILTYYPAVEEYITKNINDLRSNNDYNSADYYFENIIGDDESGTKATYVYDDFDSFQQNNVLKGHLFESMTMEVNGNIVNFKLDSVNSEYDLFQGNGIDTATLDDLVLNVKVPYQVISNNADSIDKVNNIYSWKYDNATLYKDVELTFDQSKVFRANIFLKLIDMYNQNKVKSLGILVLIIVLIVLIYIASKNLRNNKI